MDLNTERILEFDKVKELLAQRTSFSLGRELALSLRPVSDPEMVRRRQQETSEARIILARSGGAPFGGVSDVSHLIRKARVGSILTPIELVDLQSTLYGMNRMRRFISEKAADCPLLLFQGKRIADLRDLEREIGATISEEGEVLDSASPQLARIRTQIRTVQNRVREKLESIIRSQQYAKVLQNPIITIRNSRYVVPVRADQKNNFGGIVHDQSGSGQTVFIEPQAVVELNNQLRGLEAEEQEEIQRILRVLTEKVQARHDELDEGLSALAQLDLIFAKGRMAEETDSVAPLLNENRELRIYGGRHPLLRGKVVPTDVWLGKEFTTLLITGPNTGGKTVTLKTVGLLTLMAQAGLHVPADPGTELTMFDSVFADIGDEQSIEQSLSTFSSHMTKIVKILELADEHSLVLLDELGAGTDPTEGAALAMSILRHLHARGCRTVATTHYSELKTFAYLTEGVENASVEFDVNTLQPTYKLSIGLPGRSNAFAIAKRLGLSEAVIEEARASLAKEHVKVEDLIEEIEVSRRSTLKDRSEAAKLRVEMEKLKAEYEEKAEKLARERDALLQAARQEAQEIIAGARREADQLLGQLRRAGRDDVEEVARSVRAGLEAQKEQLAEAERPGEKIAGGPVDLKPGEMVRVRNLNQTAQVLEVKGEEVLVQAGILKVTVPLSELQRTSEKPVQVERARRGGASIGHQKTMNISREIHLRGMRVAEALALLDKYLDDAVLAGLPTVRVVHGKGTGTMRRAVHEALKQHPNVASFRLGGPGEGSYGVTVVEFKGR